MKNLFCVLFSLIAFVSSAHAESEQATFSKARKLFADKKFTQALDLYNQIPVKSDRWLLAVEERAWTQMHLNNYDKALADARTLTNPALTAITGTEPFLLKALVELSICDYVAVFKTLKEFKLQKREQVTQIQDLAKKGVNNVSQATLEKWMLNVDDIKALGSNINFMPQLFYKDKIMVTAAKAKSMSTMQKRLKELATIENNENYRIVQKLNLIEVESIQRVHMLSKFDAKQGEKIERSKDDLVFKDSEEVWLDEIGSYQATINRCTKKSGRTM